MYNQQYMKKIRTRIAPSPTGNDIHIGNLYTALINFAVAKKGSGSFIIRIEDTDQSRKVEGATEQILSSLKKFNIIFDEGPGSDGKFGPYIQSERLDLYQKYAHQLIDSEKAYYCYCTKEELETLRNEGQKNRHWEICKTKNDNARLARHEPSVIRLKVEGNKDVVFDDLIRGKITISTNEVDDQVLMKSDGYPTYHLGVVVDDYLMEITHIIRAEEWISSTPKHVLLYQAFGWEMPIFAHVPILRNPDKSKLSKRKNPVWASWYLDEGYLPEAVLNYLSLMGWSHPEQKEIFSLEEFIQVFDLKDIKTVGPSFDLVKLTWMNQQYIQNMDDAELAERIVKFINKDIDQALLIKLMPLVKTRMQTLKDFEILTEFIFHDPKVTPRNEAEKQIAKELSELLNGLSDWNTNEILGVFKAVLEKHSVRMSVLYFVFTGNEKGLPLPDSLAILGKDEVLRRLSLV